MRFMCRGLIALNKKDSYNYEKTDNHESRNAKKPKKNLESFYSHSFVFVYKYNEGMLFIVQNLQFSFQ